MYRTGFAASQEAYNAAVYPLFESLTRLETWLTSPEKAAAHPGPFLFGKHITEADIRLYTTIVRFDVGYHTIFRCNLRTIRDGYPALDRWMRRLYWGYPAFKDTTFFDMVCISWSRCVDCRVLTPVL